MSGTGPGVALAAGAAVTTQAPMQAPRRLGLALAVIATAQLPFQTGVGWPP